MASPIQLKNNAVGRLTSGVSAAATTLTLVSGDGAKFPTLTGAQYFPATLIRASDSAVEIVKVTARSGDVLTVVRAQEGTTGLALLAGDRVELRFTAGTLTDEIARIETIADGAVADAAAAQATANAALPKAGGTMTGSLVFSGAALRITGDFSNATASQRTAFQTSTANGNSYVGALPLGTGNEAGFVGYSAADPTNAAGILAALIGGNEARLSAFANGSGTAPPLTFYTSGSERARIDTSGRVGIGTSAPTNALQVVGSVKATLQLNVGSNYNDNYSGGIVNISNVSRSIAVTADETNTGASSFIGFRVDGSDKARIDASGQQNSVVPGGSTLYQEFKCRAWVSFNGTLAAASMIQGSGNVSSITDDGVGNYTINFTYAMPDTAFAATGMAKVGSYPTVSETARTVSSLSVRTQAPGFGVGDSDSIGVAIFR